jgi:hypothetical protein
MLKKNTVVLNQLAQGRSALVGFSRFLNNERITTDALIESAVQRCSQLVEGRHVLVINDTTDFNFRDHSNYLDADDEHLGPMSNEGDMGFYLHPGLVIDAQEGINLGLSYIKIWNREQSDIRGRGNKSYVHLPLEKKETYRWLECGMESKKSLQKAQHITIIADRESDIYQEFTLGDDKTDLIIRSSQNRSLENSSNKLYEVLSETECCGEYDLCIRENKKGKSKRKERDTIMEVRYRKVKICKPSTIKDLSLPNSIELYAVEAREKPSCVPAGEKAICWRLLTTYTVDQLSDASQIIQLYSKRWQIEMLFGTMKSKGLNFGASELESGCGLKRLCIIVLQVALKINQLSQGRGNEKEQSAQICFSQEQIPVLQALSNRYDGKTEKQKNPYQPSTLAWATWIIARMGGWKGYATESQPGNKTMRIGLMQFENVIIGWSLAKNLCA